MDDVAVALDTSAERIGTMVAAERQFAANASHQLRTPLTALRLRLEEIAELGDDDVRAEADLALRHADRLNATISELLRLARPDAERPRQPVDVAALLREHAPAWQQVCAAAHRELRVELPTRCLAMASSGGTAQVVQTLIENALEHGAGTVTVQLHDEGDVVVLTVRDEGSSLLDADAAQIFERHVSAWRRHRCRAGAGAHAGRGRRWASRSGEHPSDDVPPDLAATWRKLCPNLTWAMPQSNPAPRQSSTWPTIGRGHAIAACAASTRSPPRGCSAGWH